MNRNHVCLIICFLAVGLLRASAVNIVTFDFVATVNEVTDPSDKLGGTISASDTLTGVIEYDLDLPDGSGDPEFGSYFEENGLVSATNGAFSITHTGGFAIVVFDNNEFVDDQYLIETGSGASSPAVAGLETLIILTDAGQTALTSDSLLSTFPDISVFEEATLLISDQDTNFFDTIFIDATITMGPFASIELPGDYNEDDVVDAADYTVWRDNLGQPAGTLPNDADGGVIGPLQYQTWVTHYGENNLSTSSIIPEPTAASVALAALASLLTCSKSTYRPSAI
jgi:hypothetical protein